MQDKSVESPPMMDTHTLTLERRDGCAYPESERTAFVM